MALGIIGINSIAFGAKPTEIVEVINKLPTNTAPEWCVGEAKYEIDESTIVDTDNKPIVGNLAIVEFETIDNINIATEITSLAISPASINDGPYIFLDENNQITSLIIQHGTNLESSRKILAATWLHLKQNPNWISAVQT